MYIQITTRCNMKCEHCCYACTERGEDMSIKTFRKCLEWEDEYIALGGGEPTIHPLFWQFLGEAMAYTDVWLATNGKKTETALALAKMANRGVISCALSQDPWHEPIDQDVVSAFTKKRRQGVGGFYGNDDHDYREIRDVSLSTVGPINAGRCDFGAEGCPCEDIVVMPSGKIRLCGCADAPIIGKIGDPDYKLLDCYEQGVCWKDQKTE